MTTASTPALRSLKPLPHHPPPLPDETLESFIERLALANGMHFGQLFARLTESRRRTGPVPIDRLARLSSRGPDVLRHALPEYRFPELADNPYPRRRHYIGTGTPCELCTARHCIPSHRQVITWTRVDHYICLRHRRWVGHASLPQFSIADFPVIVKAQIRLRRFTRNTSPGRAYLAMKDAMDILGNEFDRDATFASRRRLNQFFQREHTNRLPQSYRDAAVFPDVVTLASFLGSNFWRWVSMERNDPRYLGMLKTFIHLGLVTNPYELPRDLVLWTKIYGPTGRQAVRFRDAYARMEAEQNRMNL